MPASDLEGKECVVLCNLKPRNMRGVKSHGMLLCASDKKTEGEEKVELLSPPQGTPVGERLCFGNFSADLPEPDGPNKIQKKKVTRTHTHTHTDRQTDRQIQREIEKLDFDANVAKELSLFSSLLACFFFFFLLLSLSGLVFRSGRRFKRICKQTLKVVPRGRICRWCPLWVKSNARH